MTDGEVLLGHFSDKLAECADENRITCTGFLDASQRSEAMRFCAARKARHVFFGGYEDAERTVCAFLPDYFDEADFPLYFLENEDDSPVVAVRCEYPKDAPALTHRDFLGSLMALGIKRETVGDILVSERSADVFVLPQIAEYLSRDFSRAGRVSVNVTKISLRDVRVPPQRTESHRDTVASMRLDAVVSAVFSLSRGKAEEAIVAGLVFCNDVRSFKTDAKVSEGDKIVLRGSGKARITSVGGFSKKGRTVILFDKYL